MACNFKHRLSSYYFFILLALLPLVAVKIQPLFLPKTIIGFLGISYLTFKSLQMVIEIRDGLIKEVKIMDYIRFLLFFPTFTSGPVDRFRRFQKEEKITYTKEEYSDLLYGGMNRIFRGFLYKLIIAYVIHTYILQSDFLEKDTVLSTVAYMYSYSLYLFFDFAGYSCFAIGVSYLLGIRTPENFNKPFLSRNIKDFWNRWHMSLSFWFRDFVYMRFVFLLKKKKVVKNKYVMSYLAYLLLFILMGVWHGLHWHYIVYGLYHATLIISFDIFERLNKKIKFWPSNKFMHAVGIVITFHVVCFGFLIFSGKLF